MGAHNDCHELWFTMWSEEWEDGYLCWGPWSLLCGSAWDSCGQCEANGGDPSYELCMTTDNFCPA